VFTSCCFSVVGSFIIILSYVLWKDVRSPLRRLLVFLSISDFLTATGNLIGVAGVVGEQSNSNSMVCTLQSFISTCSSICSFLWTMSIAIYLYLVISKRHTLALKLIPLFHMVCWGIPLMVISFSMAFGAIGWDYYSGIVGWCWVSDIRLISWPTFDDYNSTVVFWKIIAGKGIELFTYIFTPLVYILSKRELDFENYDQRLLLNTSVRATLQDTDRKLVLIPIIFVGVRMWGTARFLFAAIIGPSVDGIYWLAFMQGVGDSAQGWANCVLFCIFTRKIREKFIECLPRVCCCRKKEEEPSCEDMR